MSELLKQLLGEKERILPVMGVEGTGKSSLARNAMHYVAERKIFTGGVVLV